jgi:hypothetical protein
MIARVEEDFELLIVQFLIERTPVLLNAIMTDSRNAARPSSCFRQAFACSPSWLLPSSKGWLSKTFLHTWHSGATACMVLTMVIVTLSRRIRNNAKYQILHPHHPREVAKIVEVLSKWLGEIAFIPKSVPTSPVVSLGTAEEGDAITYELIRQKA